MMQTLGYKWLPYTTVIYYANFQCGDFGTLLPAQIENPSIVWTPEIVDHVHDLITDIQEIYKIFKESSNWFILNVQTRDPNFSKGLKQQLH